MIMSPQFSDMSKKMSLYVQQLQDDICQALEQFEPSTRFHTDEWTRPNGGGGKTKVIQDGTCFEKGGVNTSAVYGTITEKEAPMFQQLFTQQGIQIKSVEGAKFFATGVSLVIHPFSPLIPTTHANYRYFECKLGDIEVWWFGGGADLTPYYLDETDATHFHSVFKKACDPHGSDWYEQFKATCDTYFYLPHRQETRGIGGIFYDYQNSKSKEELYKFTKSVGHAFIDAYIPIVERHKHETFTDHQKEWQEIRRGRYVEFNLLHDRGTKFGLHTNGRIESILMSLPKHVQWRYDYHPTPGTKESELISVLQSPRNWV